ncbi:MlaA family lipoprotein [Frigidibacter oleivorans]|uniref:MlaA family lipoprotein n=1 Tax=Frigidibacter oleivorans TaxID=2487129 RepID=UPI001F1D0E51|nr:VacJ family lipoprotein [Frigidibacter oleivorans]
MLAAAAIGLSACAGGDAAVSRDAVNDPFEAQNRRVHAFNRGIDRALVKPSSQVYGRAVPGFLRIGITNVGNNLGLPAAVANNVLQGRVEPAATNTLRFLVNTTFGLGGVLDPATDMGLTERETDFGETLHVWGAAEGPYVELPLIGPSTVRDTAGMVMGVFLDPLGAALDSPESEYVLGVRVLSTIGERYRYSDTIDSLLYQSADSYAQARLLYLQNRRFELGTEAEEEAYDPYEDPYAQ